MGVLLKVFLVATFAPFVFGQEQGACYGAGSVAGAAIGAFVAALLLVAAAYYIRKLYWKSRKGKHLVLSTDPESVKDEFAFDNPGFKHEERQGWQHDAPTLPVGGKARALQAEFIRPNATRDDSHTDHARTRRVKLWARDFTGLGLRCGGGARDGVHVHSLLRSGPAAAARLHPGDKIKSIKIEFTGTPLEDAVAILSLASPYPVELEVVEGGKVSGEGRMVIHPLLKRAGSMGDVSTLEKEAKNLHPPKSPNTSHSNNSTLESKQPKGIKKITDKIITSTLERNKKEKKDGQQSTLERENEKNSKMANKHRFSDVPTSLNKPDKNKTRHSTGTDVQIIQTENGVAHIEHSEVQKRDYDPKRGMKFGIRVLPPNVPDDGVLRQKSIENGVVSVDHKTIDEPDKAESFQTSHIIQTTQVRHENETEIKKPIVAKRREKMAPPIPNARTKPIESDVSLNTSQSSNTSVSTFARSDLNSSGIKRDENGIPQELPQHMFEAAKAARSNRKSSSELIFEKEKPEVKKEESAKPSKKSKGKAPSPPESERNKTDDSILEQLKNVHDFLKCEKHHSSLLHDSSTTSTDQTVSTNTANTSTPKAYKTKLAPRIEDSINFTQDDIDDIVSKPFRKESDSLNNFYEDSKSNISSNQDGHSVVSFNNSDKSEKGSTTIELNNSDITIHSSPLNETVISTSDEASILDENERKAASLGDLSRFEMRAKAIKPTTGTLERAQSLDISGDDAEESNLSPKKRKSKSVVETSFFDSTTEDFLPDMIDEEKGSVIKYKEPRLSLNITKTSAMEGLSTFQRNRLKKGSEFGNLEDAIVKNSNSSIDLQNTETRDSPLRRVQAFDLSKDDDIETSDHLARRIMDENLKINLKLVSEFAKSTSDDSNMSSLGSSEEQPASAQKNESTPKKYDEKSSGSYDTNIPDDMKVSRNTYVNSLERPKSDMMKKLLAKNPILNVHIDQTETKIISSKDTSKSVTETSKSGPHQPDIVNFDLKSTEQSKKGDFDDFVSNIRVGSNNNSLKFNKKLEPLATGWSDASKDVQTTNVVTITTNEKSQPPEVLKQSKSYTKSIEIGEPTLRLIPDVIEGIKRRNDERDGRTLYMEPPNVALTMTQEPIQKTVTVNVAEDEYGNKVITQNVEKVSTKYTTYKSEAPLQVEQISFGIMKNPGKIDEIDFEEGNVKDVEKNILEKIKKQNPNMRFTSDEPAYTKTETIILNTQLDEKEAVALMEKIKSDPTFMAQKTPEELSQLGIKIIHDLEDIKNESKDTVEVTKTRYSINPSLSQQSDSHKYFKIESSKDLLAEANKDHITEIQVITPKTEKLLKQKSDLSKDKIASRQRVPPVEEPPLSYELDIDLLNDFISNERYHSAKQLVEAKKRTKTTTNEANKRHSDFDLPRNTTIKFRTATYESPKGTIVTSTDLEHKRLSQLDQMQLRATNDQPVTKPTILAKPSNIPVKSIEKAKPNGGSSKIPVFTSQKSLSQENLVEKPFTLPRSPPPPNISASNITGNITVTSIKSSSRHPSGL